MKSPNRVDQFFDWIKNNKVVSVIIILGIVIIAIANFTNALVTLKSVFLGNKTENLNLNPEIIPIRTTEHPDTLPPNAVRATGIGFPPPNFTDSMQRRLAAKEAAEADAKRKLAGYLKGEIVKSKSTTTNKMLSEETIEVIVNTSLQSARVISEKVHEDGSVEVVIEVPIEQ